MSAPAHPETPAHPWWRDRALAWALLIGLYLRAATLAAHPAMPCVRDECTYLKLADRWVQNGLLDPAKGGWLWAPGYPALLAAHQSLLGDAGLVRLSQVALSAVMILLAARLAFNLGGRPAGRWAAWLFALSPTLAFFSISLWSETVYLTLLLGALVGLGYARGGSALRSALPGALVGLCVLLRGVATYSLPLFALGLLWGRWRQPRAWGGVAALTLGAALVVAPWSTHASARWEGRVLSDRTLGQMMWLGNNDFAPVTFDWGNGPLSEPAFAEVKSRGRQHCEIRGETDDSPRGDPTAWDDCEVKRGFAWIQAHPQAFVARIPLRLAQLFNPNSFLTRHLKTGRWPSTPEPLRAAALGLTLVWSLLAVLGGTLGLAARARSWMGVVIVGVLLYHMLAISALAGLSRYRVPLDGLWLLYAATLLSAPGEALAALRADRRRVALAALSLAVLLPLCLTFLPLAWS